MGTWGVGLFENDVATDIRFAFEDALSEGLDVFTATQRVFAEFADELADFDDRPVVYLALAALQLGREALQPEIRDEALRIIMTDEAWAGWQEAEPALVAERKQVLQVLKAGLIEA